LFAVVVGSVGLQLTLKTTHLKSWLPELDL